MVAGSRGSSLIAQGKYIQRLLDHVTDLEEQVKILQWEKHELEKAGVGQAQSAGEGGSGPGWLTGGAVPRVASGSSDSDGVKDVAVLQNLIRISEGGIEEDRFADLKLRVKVHGKEVHVWKKILRLMRMAKLQGIDIEIYAGGVQLIDIKEEGDSDG